MRWSICIALILFSFYCGEALAAPAVEHERRTVATLDREEPSASATETATTATNNDSSQTSTATTTDAKSATKTTAATTRTISSDDSDATAVTTSVPSLDTSNSPGESLSQNSNKSTYTGGLPIQPEISPALGVGGFILLVSGAALALIGIRKRWLYISFSTAFCAALGVTVLIEYVMNPPVTNAVQGGYLVAVVITGAVFGGLALVFKEITEGLCCLLGGFCIGMWLMTVKAGGLVTESGAKVGVIIAFAVGFYCLSFSHYTRSYGSMVCTSFAGATALVLGIDCFSRAGLKEFWLYIWGLNDNMFPLGTNTYPVTRNIRVELAITIIMAVFGVIAQMRLWKVIKERRANEESSRKEEERKKEETEAEVGRQLEEKNLRERAEWEHMYGNGSSAKEPSMTETVVVDDSRRGSDGFKSSNNEKGTSFEMKEMASPAHGGTSDAGNNLDAVEEVVRETLENEEDGVPRQQSDGQEDHENAHPDTKDTSKAASQCEDDMSRPATPPPEKAFHVNTNMRDDESENGAIIGSEAGTPRSKRFSGRSFRNRLSWRSGNDVKTNHESHSQEALIEHDDATSSVAGIIDDVQSLSSRRYSIESGIHNDADNATQQSESTAKNLLREIVLAEASDKNLSPQPSQASEAIVEETPVASQENEENQHVSSQDDASKHPDQTTTSVENPTVEPTKNFKDQTAEPKAPEPDHDVQKSQPVTEVTEQPHVSADSPQKNEKQDQQISPDEPLTVEKDAEHAAEAAEPQITATETKSEIKPVSQTFTEKTMETIEKSDEPAEELVQIVEKPVAKPTKKLVKQKLDMSTVKRIPEQTSKVVHTFRTNEWAKHLSDAEVPQLEPLEFDYEQPVDTPGCEEAAAPVNVEGLLQTPLNAQPPPAVSSPMDTPTRPEQSRRQSRLSMAPAADLPRTKTRNSMQDKTTRSPPISRNVSSASLSPPQEHDDSAGLQSPSAPYLTITAPSHGRDSTNEQTDSPRWSGPPPLLAVRENMVRNRLSSTSLRYDPYASRSASRQSLGEPTRISPTFSILEESDEQHMTMASPNPPLHDEDDMPLSRRRTLLQRQTIESPSAASLQSLEQRARSPGPDSGRSASVMAAWRQSVREDISSRRGPLALNSPPLGSTSPERPRNLWGSVQQMKDASAAQVGDAIADGMQRGSMTDLHRQAMRRMQASANRKL
ncbi:hypothetical protein N7532_006551 [Penicillium argentinense]|uniref:TM7S3/TM198-like domain-containing protein n=1 Tax=Penicillium argentinense TaxID=1131581 RepID=A0A9W9FGA4_9EURO|nr:uncharacterized protein N7532_006551 [Penicillium argentinense]KAJ5099550.1 hypothetical protein N7532_006551 [Penicillium argentinense]